MKTSKITILGLLGVILLSSCQYEPYETPELLQGPTDFEFKVQVKDDQPKRVQIVLENATRDGYIYGIAGVIDTVITSSTKIIITKNEGAYAYATIKVTALKKEDDIKIGVKPLREGPQMEVWRHSSCEVNQTSIEGIYIDIRK